MTHKWKDIRRMLSPEQEEETRRYVKSAAQDCKELPTSRSFDSAEERFAQDDSAVS